jgi:hypothetical protein
MYDRPLKRAPMRRRLRRVFFALTIVSSALLAHLAIDLAGDFLLSHDAYDDVAHHSRESVFIVACVLAAIASWRTLCAVRAELRGSRGSLRAILHDSVPASCGRFVAAVAALSVPALLAMAGLDAALDGTPIDDVADLLGGSAALGLTCTLGSALAIATLAWTAIRALARLDRVVLRLVAALAERARHPQAATATVRRVRPATRSYAGIFARSFGLRAPPAMA